MNELEVKRTPEVIGAEIRMYVDAGRRVTLLCGIEIGRRLKEAKELLAHGEWLPWLERETDFSTSSAARYIKAFEEYGASQLGLFGPETNFPALGNLSISKALALLSVPESERESFAEEIGAEGLSTRELERAIKERDEALKRAKAAEDALHEADEGHGLAIAELQEKLDAAREQAEKGKAAEEDAAKAQQELETVERQLLEARDAIRELRDRPVEVAIQRDEAAIEEAARTARTKAESEAAGKLAELQKKLDAAEKKAEKAEKTADKAKKEAEKAGAGVSEKLAAAEAEAKQARQELEEARKALKLADADVARFSVYFNDVQESFQTMLVVIDEIRERDAERAGKLQKAVQSVLEQMLGQVEE